MNFTHIANPVRVTAYVIDKVLGESADGSTLLRMQGGAEFTVSASQTARMTPAAGDYFVIQEDGYEYLNPKDVFERKYRETAGTSSEPMQEGAAISDARGNFGFALGWLKAGQRVARAGWNGKGMFLQLTQSSDYRVRGEDDVALLAPDVDLAPWIGMKTADNKFVPWLASQTDMLAEDWQVV